MIIMVVNEQERMEPKNVKNKIDRFEGKRPN